MVSKTGSETGIYYIYAKKAYSIEVLFMHISIYIFRSKYLITVVF